MSSARVAADYIRAHRATESDGIIRAALDAQGFTPELLDEAFRLAGPRPEEAAAAGAGPVASLRLRAWLFGGSLALAAGAALLLPVFFWEEAPEKEADAVSAPPAGLAAYLPPDLSDADAADDYRALLVSDPGRDWAAPPQPLTAAQVALLDRALTKSRSSLGCRVSVPGLEASLAAAAMRMKLLYAASRVLGERSRRAEESGGAAAADAALRREVLLGWHAVQDCDVALQNVGFGVVVDAMGRQGRLAGGADIEAREKTVRELEGFVASPAVVRSIRADAADPAKLPALLARLSDPAARRAYGHWTLAMAATSWSAGEIALARPAPERVRFFADAAALDDGLMRRLAQNFDAALDETERRLGAVPAGLRAGLAADIVATAAQGAELPAPR